MTLLICLSGWALVSLALLHFALPRYFDWHEQLARLSLGNRQLMQVHTFFIALVVFLMGLLCITSSDLLLTTPLGRRILAGLSVFWAIRLYIQFFWYSSDLWRGKSFETFVHICFSMLWLSLTLVFAWGSYSQD